MTNLFLISSAFAQAAAPATENQPTPWGTPVFFVGMIAIFYFLFIRPQRKQVKTHQKFIAELQKGDEIVTQSGVLGKITGIADKVVTVEIAPNVKIKVLKQTVLQKVDSALTAASPQG